MPARCLPWVGYERALATADTVNAHCFGGLRSNLNSKQMGLTTKPPTHSAPMQPYCWTSSFALSLASTRALAESILVVPRELRELATYCPRLLQSNCCRPATANAPTLSGSCCWWSGCCSKKCLRLLLHWPQRLDPNRNPCSGFLSGHQLDATFILLRLS